MEAGNLKISPIVQAISDAEKKTTAEIQVHLSKRLFERDPLKRATHLFYQYGMTQTINRNAVLFYINLRQKKFAIVGDENIHKIVGQKYWDELAKHLHQDLQSTHVENAIALAVKTIGVTLAKFFPRDPNAPNPNELPDVIKTDG